MDVPVHTFLLANNELKSIQKFRIFKDLTF